VSRSVPCPPGKQAVGGGYSSPVCLTAASSLPQDEPALHARHVGLKSTDNQAGTVGVFAVCVAAD